MASTSSGTPSISPSSTTSNSAQWDVFISFRGPDTRSKFTNYLYNDLGIYELRPFRDDPELRVGEVISDALIEAIRNSKTYVVVFSENYAYSPWCLDELVEIYKCSEEKKRLVISVYYHIEPSVVRHQTDSLNNAFIKHETGRFRDKIDQVNQWRRALKAVAKYSGHTMSPESDGAVTINEIAREILQHVKPKTLHVADHFVVRGNVQVIKNSIAASMSSKTVKGVIKIGLYGLGGVGKTTLAKALYNHLLEISDFKASCFLADVRATFGRPNGLVSLQNQLISACVKSITKDEVHNKDQGTEFMKKRFGLTKVVLVLDDVDNTEQCNSFMGPFAPGSVVIITTRDTAILDKIQVESSHQFEVNVMNDAESLKLFRAHAFPNGKPDKTLMALFKDDILSLSGNLPLALRVFGSHLAEESEDGWEDYINKLKLKPNSTIQDRLMISLDAMDDLALKNIFIDIACFFNGMELNKVVEIMETCYPVNVDYNIHILIKKSLMRIDFKKLWIHDLLRDMGREVARNKCSGEPQKCSRLWISEDICDVLEEGKGKETIEGIIPSNFNYENALTGVEFSTKTFKKMRKLRFLYLKDVNLSGSFEQRFGSLTWLCWDCCPLTELGSDFWPKKLAMLKLRNSNIKKWELTKVFEKLKTLDMSNSLYITTLPDFRKLPSLVTLNLEGCTSLEKFDIVDGCLRKLVSLNLGGCANLRSICDRHCSLKALEVLVFAECEKLESLPDKLWEIASFRKLCIKRHGKFANFESPFKKLYMSESSLTTLPSSLSQLLNLVHVDIRHHNLVSIEQLPPNLKKLYLHDSMSLKSLPDLSDFKHLVDLSLQSSPNVVSIEHLPPNLEMLNIHGCSSLITLPNLSNSMHLVDLRLVYSPNVVAIEHLPPNVEKLCIYNFSGLKRLPNLSNLRGLKKLKIKRCSNLTEIVGLEELFTSLIVLRCSSSLVACTSFRRIFQILQKNYFAIQVDELPDWIHSCDGDTFAAPNVQHNCSGMILCLYIEDHNAFEYTGDYSSDRTVTNVTTGETWKNDKYFKDDLVMIMLPRSIISVSGGDRIVISGDGDLRGFLLVYDD